jgi:hypothetical protein
MISIPVRLYLVTGRVGCNVWVLLYSLTVRQWALNVANKKSTLASKLVSFASTTAKNQKLLITK